MASNVPAIRSRVTAPCDTVIPNPLSVEPNGASENDMRTLIYAAAFGRFLRDRVMTVELFNERVRKTVNRRPQLVALNGRPV